MNCHFIDVFTSAPQLSVAIILHTSPVCWVNIAQNGYMQADF